MDNFNPEEHNNVINPYTLSADEQAAIVAAIDDKRLKNPPGDYFQLELSQETIDIPKLKYISRKRNDGNITRISTTDFIRQKLESIDTNQSGH